MGSLMGSLMGNLMSGLMGSGLLLPLSPHANGLLHTVCLQHNQESCEVIYKENNRELYTKQQHVGITCQQWQQYFLALNELHTRSDSWDDDSGTHSNDGT